MTRRNSFSRDGSMKVSPIVHQRKESEIGVDFDQGIDLGATEFHTSHDELNETIAESRPSLYASFGLATSKIADDGKGGAFETIEETEDEIAKEPPNRQMNRSVLLARTSRFLAAMASIAVSVGAIVGTMKGTKSNRSDVEAPDSREGDENERSRGFLDKINRRMAAIASIVASAAIIVGATSEYWKPSHTQKSGNHNCTVDNDCVSKICGSLNEEKVLKYLGDTSPDPLVPLGLDQAEMASRKTHYENLLKQNVCKCTDDIHCTALKTRDKCHTDTSLCYEKASAKEPQIGNAKCASAEQCKSEDCGKLNVEMVLAELEFDKVKGLNREDVENNEELLRDFFPVLNEKTVCRCKKHPTCDKGYRCNNGSGLCFPYEKTKSPDPTRQPNTQTMPPTTNPSAHPTLNPTVTMQPTYSYPKVVREDFEIDVEVKSTIASFGRSDLCRFADKMVQLTPKYGPGKDINFSEVKEEEMNPNVPVGCEARRFFTNSLITSCHVYFQTKLVPSKTIRIVFKMRWRSKHLTRQNLAKFATEFPLYLNDFVMDWQADLLSPKGFGASTWDNASTAQIKKYIGGFDPAVISVTEATEFKSEDKSASGETMSDDFQDGGENIEFESSQGSHNDGEVFDMNDPLPLLVEPARPGLSDTNVNTVGIYSENDPALEETKEEANSVVAANFIDTSISVTQLLSMKTEIRGIEMLILQEDILRKYLRPQRYNATSLHLPLLRSEPFISFIKQVTSNDLPGVDLFYKLHWSFCLSDNSSLTEYFDIGKKFISFVNKEVQSGRFLQEFRRVGIQGVASVSNMTQQIQEDNLDKDYSFSDQCKDL